MSPTLIDEFTEWLFYDNAREEAWFPRQTAVEGRNWDLECTECGKGEL